MKRIERAIISVFCKEEIVELGRFLKEMGVEILSSGGTAAYMKENKIEITEISSVTGFPEILEGRVKTLHPKIHGAILADKSKESHLKQIENLGIEPVDLVVVNLYPFEEVTAKKDVSLSEAMENIDIGGPAMLRAAAKNWQSVAAVSDPADYPVIIEEMKKTGGFIGDRIRQELAGKVFALTSAYDACIHKYFCAAHEKFPLAFGLVGTKVQDLRYGENPHQGAAIYRERAAKGIASAKKLHGKELSFNNFLDLDAAYQLALDFEQPAAVIVKHTNPCGVATGETPLEAFQKAFQTDPTSSFGGIVGFNRTVTKEAADALGEIFLEALIAPAYEKEALAVLQKKKNLRILEAEFAREVLEGSYDIKRISGGFLVQERNLREVDEEELKVVTRRTPTEAELRACIFAWKVIRHVKSNAVIFTREDRTVAIGAGQMSRVDSVKVAVMKAMQPLAGTVVGSDAFFPFRDGIDEAAKAGATAIIQPGGSVRDEEAIEAANDHNMAMLFTGWRQFKH